MFAVVGKWATNHYYDRHLLREAVKVLPGEYYAIESSHKLLVAVVGACVAVCLYDPKRRIVGLNHFMHTQFSDYAENMMNTLLERVTKMGAETRHLEAKVFGGSFLNENLNGKNNADFALRFLQKQRIPIVAQDILETYPRKIYLFAENARVRVKRLHHLNNATVLEREARYIELLNAQSFK